MGRVAGMQCIMSTLGFGESCSFGPDGDRVHVHHIREGQGASQRAQDTLTVPLCFGHHLGGNGVHGLGKRGFYARYGMDELDLLAATLERLA